MSSSIKKVGAFLFSASPCPLQVILTFVIVCPLQQVMNSCPSRPSSCLLSFKFLDVLSATKHLKRWILSERV